jgi:hypothetical protein
MRENRQSGSEGGETFGLPYPYPGAVFRADLRLLRSRVWHLLQYGISRLETGFQ